MTRMTSVRIELHGIPGADVADAAAEAVALAEMLGRSVDLVGNGRRIEVRPGDVVSEVVAAYRRGLDVAHAMSRPWGRG